MSLPFGVKLLGVEANRTLLDYFSHHYYSHLKGYWAANASCAPESLGPEPALGAIPELVDWLWNDVQPLIPSSRPWVVMGTATLVNPTSEVVFAFVAGAHCALKLPRTVCSVAITAGAEPLADGLSAIGEGWVRVQKGNVVEQLWRDALDYSGNPT